MQGVSNVARIVQRVPEQTIGASSENALLAAIAAGVVPARTDWARVAVSVEPRASTQAVYGETRSLYADLYPATASIVRRLAALQEQTALTP
jgi:xylulokinase